MRGSSVLSDLPLKEPPSRPPVFAMPPQPRTAGGDMRRVGVEVEFAGLAAEAAATAVALALGGALAPIDPHAFAVTGTPLGPITIMLDTRYAHPDTARALFGAVGEHVAPFIGHAARHFVPTELVTAPVPLDRLHEIDAAVAALREAGARGTADSMLYAFGLHFNPEPPRLDAACILAHLRAFVLAEAWLELGSRPNSTRKILGFADRFPEVYVRRLLSPDYRPDLDQFCADYLVANPTRNRGLDLLPILAFLDPARVRALLPREKINPRPTLHYRLPDARVSEAGWSIASEWNRWVAVERLAADADALGRLGETYLASDKPPPRWTDLVAASLALT